MKSITLFTSEIDDMELAMEELQRQLKEQMFVFLENTCGIVFCDSDMDVEELVEALSDTFDFPIMGGTALAMINKKEGYQVSGISLMILTADDCQFYMDITDEVTDETAEEIICATYGKLSESLPEREKLIYVIGSKTLTRGGDIYVNSLSKVNSGVPVYGALASDRFVFDDVWSFCGDKVVKMGLAMLIITGNVHPIFQSEFSLNRLTSFTYKITSCSGCYIYELDGKPFMDVLEEAGLKSQQDNVDNVIMEFLGTPFLMVEEMENGEKVQKLRNLTGLNKADKSGKFLGDMAEGATLHIGLIRKEDVQASVTGIFEKIMERIKKSEYSYSTFICSSCGSRYLILATEPDAEAKAYSTLLPKNMELVGFYSYGEICPQIMDSGNIYNCFLNDTFTILAI